MQYDSQTLLFKEAQPISSLKERPFEVPKNFYDCGYCTISDVRTPDEAVEILQRLIASVDPPRAPLLSHFLPHMRLAKADVIPVCEDVVASSYQILHFDMGHPFLAKEEQTMYLVTALYAPLDGHMRMAKTRILPLQGLLSDERWGGASILKRKITQYVERHGDGWDSVNTYRLACFARFLDAADGTTELAEEKDRTVGHWFRDEVRHDLEESWRYEYEFYKRRDIDLSVREHRVQLQPGQMLFFDNTRVVHGRIGSRKAKEIYQFLLGVERVDQSGIQQFIDYLMIFLTNSV